MIPLFALVLRAPDPYLQLAEALIPSDWDARVVQVESALREGAALPDGRTPLEAQRAAVRRWTPVLEGLHLLTEKPYSRSGVLTVEEFQGVERLSGLARWAARVRFADGDRHGATTALLDALTLEWRTLGRGFLTPRSVLDGFADALAQIPLAECERVRRVTDTMLVGVDRPTVSSTRLRLLRLHMRVEAYRWRNLRLPGALRDAAPPEETLDPMTGKPYGYETPPSGVLLFSEGFEALGRITLRGQKRRAEG